MQDGATTVIEVPVLIVGGGGCGLALTVFLQNLGVSSLTIERNPTTADLPRAHILNQRTLEIFDRALDVAYSGLRHSAPMEENRELRTIFRVGVGLARMNFCLRTCGSRWPQISRASRSRSAA